MCSVWEQLSDVERTAVHVCLCRTHAARALGLPDQPLWDTTCDAALVAHCMPAAEQEHKLAQAGTDMVAMMAVRTAELDEQLLAAVRSAPALRQVLLLGAGLDPRAWRLPWPPATKVWEVDSGAVEGVKAQVLEGMPRAAAARTFVQADLSQARGGGGLEAGGGGLGLVAALQAQGWSPAAPSLWLMEGLVGYLSREQAGDLLQVLYECSAPGSTLILTCPPTLAIRAGAEARGMQLHHQTFEEAEETLGRVAAAGWANCQLHTAASLGAKWGVPTYFQAQIIAHR